MKLAARCTKGAWECSFSFLSFVDVMPKAVRTKSGWLIREDRQTKGTRGSIAVLMGFSPF